jgi:lactoylglutathione lyase
VTDPSGQDCLAQGITLFVDATCDAVVARGVELLNGPMDRPWDLRTANVVDPGGHIWEVAH